MPNDEEELDEHWNGLKGPRKCCREIRKEKEWRKSKVNNRKERVEDMKQWEGKRKGKESVTIEREKRLKRKKMNKKR